MDCKTSKCILKRSEMENDIAKRAEIQTVLEIQLPAIVCGKGDCLAKLADLSFLCKNTLKDI